MEYILNLVVFLFCSTELYKTYKNDFSPWLKEEKAKYKNRAVKRREKWRSQFYPHFVTFPHISTKSLDYSGNYLRYSVRTPLYITDIRYGANTNKVYSALLNEEDKFTILNHEKVDISRGRLILRPLDNKGRRIRNGEGRFMLIALEREDIVIHSYSNKAGEIIKVR